MKKFGSTRLGAFCAFVIICGSCYLVDCVVAFRAPLGTPWLERGIYAGGPAGFWVTIVIFLCGVLRVIFWDER